jgi:signal transduction histidine kinase
VSDHTFIPTIQVSLDYLLELESDTEALLEQPQLDELLRNHAIALADLQSQVQERTRQLQHVLQDQAILRHINDRVRDSLDEHYILQVAMDELAVGLKLSRCDTKLYDADHQRESNLGAWSPPYDYRAQGRLDLPTPQTLLICQDQPYQVCELDDRRDTALLVCPVVDNQEILGDLFLHRERDLTFDEAEIDLVQQVASQCAVAIRQARLYQTAQTQVAELERLNQIKDEFLSTVSYELRIPMANMKMAIQMLCLSINKKEEGRNRPGSTLTDSDFAPELFVLPGQFFNKIDRYLEILRTECDREAKLIEDLLDLQQLDTNMLSLIMSAIRLPEWLPYMVMPFEKRCQDYGLALQLNVAPDLPSLVCDQISLSRIVSELLNNACKYTPQGGRVTVTAKHIQTLPAGKSDTIQIRVCNSGVEIPADEVARVFDKFYRIPKFDIRKLGGTGLGLALVQKLVIRLGGRLYVESGQGQTCFVVELAG